MGEDGGIEHLITFLRDAIQPKGEHIRDGREKAQEDVAAALQNLALNSENEDVIREQGGIPPLIEVLRDGSLQAQAKAAGALSNLATNQKNQDVIRNAGGIQ